MNIQGHHNPNNHTFARLPNPSSKGNDHETGKELEMMQKKAVLYNIKNQLLKYDHFQDVSDEELHNLYNNLHQQTTSDKNSQENSLENEDADHLEGNSSILSGKEAQPKKNNISTFSKKGLLQFGIIALVLLCLWMRLSQTNYKQYNLGQFSIYSTRYDKTLTQLDILQHKKTTFWGHLINLLQGSQQQNKIKLYLPSTVPKVKIYDLNKPTEQECLLEYRPVCMDYRLTTFGSVNIELQACILDLLSKPQHIIFQGKVDNFLPILVAGEKLKRMQTFTQQKYQITVLESDQSKVIELNSLKLSIIDTNLQNEVKIFKIESEKEVIRAISQHQYAIVSEKLFKMCLESEEKFSNTMFIVNLPQGISKSFQNKLSQMVKRNMLKIQEIRPTINAQKTYIETQFINGQVSSQQFYRFSRIIVIKILAKKEKEKVQAKIESPGDVAVIEDKRPITPTIPTPQLPSTPHHLLRKLGIKNHPCIVQDMYITLPNESILSGHKYVLTIIGFRLLVKEQIAPLYRFQGALSPELLFFISQNIKTQDKVFIANEIFVDDLIVLTLANTVRTKSNIQCVYKVQKHEALTENLKINNLANFVSFSYLDKDDQKTISTFYQENNFTVFFTSIGYFSRDYTRITTLPASDRMIIFLWNSGPSDTPFMVKLTKIHQVWVILQRSDKIQNQKTCLDYGLVPFTADDVGKMSNVWVVVQL